MRARAVNLQKKQNPRHLINRQTGEEERMSVVSGEEEDVPSGEESQSQVSSVDSLDSTSHLSGYSSGYNSDEYWFSNKGCEGCSKRSYPSGMHPSQKYHLDGCLSSNFEKYSKKYKKEMGDVQSQCAPDSGKELTTCTSDGEGEGGDSDEYWYGNKGCEGCCKASFPQAPHPSQKYHLSGCLSDEA